MIYLMMNDWRAEKMSDLFIKRIQNETVPAERTGAKQPVASASFAQLLAAKHMEASPAAQKQGVEPEQLRKSISQQMDELWRSGLRQWRNESEGMAFPDAVAYQDEKAAAWVTELMHKRPALFREWLNQEQPHIRQDGLDAAIVPDGFTMEDYRRWMAKDVLEYL